MEKATFLQKQLLLRSAVFAVFLPFGRYCCCYAAYATGIFLLHTKTWSFSLALRAAFICGVLFLSGMNLLGYEVNTKTFFYEAC